MSAVGIPTVMLALPLFYGQARRIREGVMAHVDRHGGWRLVECDLEQAASRPEVFTGVDAVITWTGGDTGWMKGLDARGLPVVNCMDDPPAVPGISRVATEWPSLARLVVAHFKDLGLEHAAYLERRIGTGSSRHHRLKALREITREAGITCHGHELRAHAWPGTAPAADEHKVADFLRALPKPCGVLCEDDPAAVRVLEIAARHGLRVPSDLAVVGQGNRLIGRTGRPALTTIVPPGEEIGLKAAEVLSERMAGRLPPGGLWLLPCTDLLIRDSTQTAAADPALERAWRLFDRRVLEGITVQELAAAAGVSTKTLVKRFGTRFGIDPAGEIRRRRTEEAKRLLAETDTPVAEIGRRCGFPSPSNFFNFFRRNTGASPTDFRRSFAR
ncbi:substrate-binding domain-containing protein [Luteolibacter ambystomatis]|uniref:Substrate-binding domain-containing protein n=1 Tax=Luteolibacter ambystomatis TaxID=2824561 RepID=A0A975G7K3_9BACT|nr:substrate-binding domain-containing protein [Luteolibacter ambystomatis]QUE50273.1 substrate-binding domain-containing protein [Luteolibacter ambystomatis]